MYDIIEGLLAFFIKLWSTRIPLEGAVTDERQMANPWRRLSAFTLDYFVITAAFVAWVYAITALTRVAYVAAYSDTKNSLVSYLAILVVLGVPIAVFWLYLGWMEGAVGATLGKLVVGIKVVGSGGGRVSTTKATVRFLVKLIPYSWPLTLGSWEGQLAAPRGQKPLRLRLGGSRPLVSCFSRLSLE